MRLVLIVEDYENIKNLYAEAFSRAGYAVTTASSGQQGLDATKKEEFDVIILDLLMLELSGTDFLKAFHPDKHPHTKVVVVSNLDSPNVVKKTKELGAVEYLVKANYTPDQLVQEVQKLFGNTTPQDS